MSKLNFVVIPFFVSSLILSTHVPLCFVCEVITETVQAAVHDRKAHGTVHEIMRETLHATIGPAPLRNVLEKKPKVHWKEADDENHQVGRDDEHALNLVGTRSDV